MTTDGETTMPFTPESQKEAESLKDIINRARTRNMDAARRSLDGMYDQILSYKFTGVAYDYLHYEAEELRVNIIGRWTYIAFIGLICAALGVFYVLALTGLLGHLSHATGWATIVPWLWLVTCIAGGAEARRSYHRLRVYRQERAERLREMRRRSREEEEEAHRMNDLRDERTNPWERTGSLGEPYTIKAP